MDAVIKIPIARLAKTQLASIRLSGAPTRSAVGEGVANLLLESGGNALLENDGVILIN